MTSETGETIRWSAFFIAVGAVLCTIALTIWDYNKTEAEMEVRLYEKSLEVGVSPLAAKCAFDPPQTSNNPICLIMAAQGFDPEKTRNTLLEDNL